MLGDVSSVDTTYQTYVTCQVNRSTTVAVRVGPTCSGEILSCRLNFFVGIKATWNGFVTAEDDIQLELGRE